MSVKTINNTFQVHKLKLFNIWKIWQIGFVVRASCSLDISHKRDVSAKHTLRERTTYSKMGYSQQKYCF